MRYLLFILLLFVIILSPVFSQTEADNISVPKKSFEISANYKLTSLHYSRKGETNGSILTWRDIYLHGGQLNIDFAGAPFSFKRSNIGIGYSSSFNGYWTDDDANNSVNQISATQSVNTKLLSFSYEIRNEGNIINKVIGMDVNCVWFETYGDKLFYSWGIYFSKGLSTKYDAYKLCLYGGAEVNLLEGFLGYIKITGLVGIASFLDLADWVKRQDFMHPVSFYSFGLAYRTIGEIEFALNLDIISLFAKAQLLYDVCPAGIEILNLKNGKKPDQFISSDYGQSSLNVGLKVRL